jgi:DNA repair exonuclease SbcCD ATPase subunit
MGLGMLTGVMTGAIDEDDTQSFYDRILDKVNGQLQSGSYAIIMDVEEDDEVIVNSYLEPYHAMITRTNIVDECNQYDQQQLDKLNKEIDTEEGKLKTAPEEAKLAIKSKIDELKAEREKRNKKHKTRMEDLKKQIRERIENVNAKIRTANEKRKERLKAHKEKLEEKFNEASEDVAWVYL